MTRQRDLSLEHLRQGLPDLSRKAHLRIIRRMFCNLGTNLFEWFKLPGLSMQQLNRLAYVEGLEHLESVLSEGRGVIFVSGHFGNWEIMPLFFRTIGFEGSVLARQLRYGEYESFLIRMRQEKGVETVVRGGSLREMVKVLRANRIMGIMPDQDIDSVEGTFVPFLGKPAYTPIGPALLSIMTKAPIVPVFNIREGKRFRIVLEPPIPIPQQEDRAAAIEALTMAWSAVLERYVRAYPDHWVWMHRRWKTRPEHVRRNETDEKHA